MTDVLEPTYSRVSPLTPFGALRLLVLRNYIVYRSAWALFITGFLEPVGDGLHILAGGKDPSLPPLDWRAATTVVYHDTPVNGLQRARRSSLG